MSCIRYLIKIACTFTLSRTLDTYHQFPRLFATHLGTLYYHSHTKSVWNVIYIKLIIPVWIGLIEKHSLRVPRYFVTSCVVIEFTIMVDIVLQTVAISIHVTHVPSIPLQHEYIDSPRGYYINISFIRVDRTIWMPLFH